jgi:hypothetical protein
MTREQYLLGVLAEECAELAKVASKASRFGLQDSKPGSVATNAARLMEEYAHIMAVMRMVARESVYMRGVFESYQGIIARMVSQKQEKVEQMMVISRGRGRLDDGEKTS